MKIPTSTSVHFATPEQRSHIFLLRWSSCKFMPAAASKLRASHSSHVSTLLLWISPFIGNQQIKIKPSMVWIFKQLDLIWTFFSQWPIISRTKILTFSPESPCICREPGKVKVNVKFTLEQESKAQKGSKDMPLLFL